MSRIRRFSFPAAAVLLSLLLVYLVVELALRIHHGAWFTMRDLRGSDVYAPSPRRLTGEAPAIHDELLGWVPRPGQHDWPGGWTSVVDDTSLRENGQARPDGEPILTVGDSFTWGDEVDDHETWPSHLERLSRQPVYNAGVFGYGFDQAVLRAEKLMPELRPKLVIAALIPHDVKRCQMSYYYGPKPFFSLEDGSLHLRNTPVPSYTILEPNVPSWLGRSYLAHAVLRRLRPQDWYPAVVVIEHRRGLDVALALVDRLASGAEAYGAKLVFMTLTGAGGDLSKVAPLAERARKRGAIVVDLAPEIQRRETAGSELFLRRGHLSPEMNAWISAEVYGRIQ